MSILVALLPGKMNTVTMSEQPAVSESTVYVKLVWDLPVENGSPISQYRIELYSKTNSGYSENTSLCNGADSSVVSSRQCLINISEFRAAGFGYSKRRTSS